MRRNGIKKPGKAKEEMEEEKKREEVATKCFPAIAKKELLAAKGLIKKARLREWAANMKVRTIKKKFHNRRFNVTNER